jgi:hypothetical protein
MNRLARRTGLGLALSIGLLTTACSSGPTLYPVTGKVTVKDQPAVGALVMFFPEGKSNGLPPSTGVCGADGTFTLTTGTGEGAPAGKYIVTVSWPDPKVKVSEQQKMMGMGGDAPDVLQGAYSKDKSPLRAEVKAEKNTLDPFAIK